MVDETVVTQGSQSKPWDRARVMHEAQQLYQDAPESSVKLKCLEMILDLLPPEQAKKSDGDLREAARLARQELGR